MIRKRLGVILIVLMLLILTVNSAFAYDINEEMDTPFGENIEKLNAPIGDINEEWDVPLEEINEDLNAHIEDNQLSQDTSTFKDLNQTINGNDASEISLTSDYTFNSTTDSSFNQGISISRNLTINGNGHTLDGKNAARIFLITDSKLNVIFRDLIFINGKANNGGAISGNVTAFNCTFINNTATNYGGAMYKGSAFNCSFENNTAKDGAAIYVNSKYVTIADCIFLNNTASGYGGAVSIDTTSNVNISNCAFKGNKAKNGGALSTAYTTNTLISDSNFTDNNATSSGGAAYFDFALVTFIDNCLYENNIAQVNAGAFAWILSSGNITGTRFKRNSAGENGGALFVQMSNSSELINSQNLLNCSFIANHGKNGGAIYSNGYYTISGDTFTNNTADENGGAVYSDDSGYFEDSHFEDNSAEGNGGAVFCHDAAFFYNNEFKSNSADGNGGAVFCHDDCSFYRTNFTMNSAYDAGAIYSNDYNVFFNLKFNNNTALNSGGAVYCNMDSNFTVSEFRGNSAHIGSAIYIEGNFIVITDSSFLSNKADPEFEIEDKKYLALAISMSGYDDYINAIFAWFDPEFHNVTYWNGTVTNTDINPPIRGYKPGMNFTFEIYDLNENLIDRFDKMTNKDGNLIADYSHLDVGEYICKIIHYEDDYLTGVNLSSTLKVGEFGKLYNKLHFASDNGIVNLTQNYTYSLDFDTINEIYVEYSNLTINGNGYVIDALNQSFAIMTYHLNEISICNANFIGNISLSALNMTSFNVINSSFANSSSSIKCEMAHIVYIAGCNFDNSGYDNYKMDITAGLELLDGDQVIIEDSNFTNHNKYYGAVYLYNNTANLISGCIFNNNSADSGGAVDGIGLGELVILNSSFYNNSADFGGAVFFIGDNFTVNQSTFINNSANLGGAIRCSAEDNLIMNSLFLSNKASYTYSDAAVNDNLQATIVFAGDNNFINAIDSPLGVRFVNVSYWDGNITNTDIAAPMYDSHPGQLITIKIYDKDDNLLETRFGRTDKNDQLAINLLDAPSGVYKFVFYHEDDEYYTNSTLHEFNLTDIGNYTTVGDFTILQMLINNAKDNDVINLTRNYTYSPELDTIDHIIINKNNVTINGNGHTINGLNQSRIFEIDAENVVLNNMTFANGTAKQTLIFIWSDASNCEINNCNFLNNNPDRNWEDIFVFAKNLTIRNTNFINTTGIAVRLTDGAKNVSLDNCSFINNTYALISDGAENIIISNCSFMNSSAIELKTGTVIIEDSNFTAFNGSLGGAINIRANYSTILNSIFTGNTAEFDGGAIFLDADDFNMFNCTFIANIAHGNGGALTLTANTTTISSCNFFNNSARVGGGAIHMYVYENSLVDNSVFKFNSAEEGSAIFWWGMENLLNNSTLLDNQAHSRSISLDGDIEDVISISFRGGNNFINAIYSPSGFDMKDVVYWNGEITNSGNRQAIRNQYPGVNITFEIYDSEKNLVENITLATDEESRVYYDLLGLPFGDYSFTAYHLEDEYYTYLGELNGTFSVNRYGSSVDINIDDKAEFPYSDCNISFDVVNRTTVRVVITDSYTYEVYINQTVEEDYIIVDLNPNDDYYNITVYNELSEDYYGSHDSRLFKIIKANSSISIDPIPDVVYNNELTVGFDGEHLSSVNVTVRDSNNNIVFTKIATSTSVTIPVLPVGAYNITLVNRGDEYYTESSDSRIFNIIKALNYVNVTVENVVYGKEVVIHVSADVDGDYVLDVNGTNLTINVVDGKGNASLHLPIGSYYANATFNDPNYDAIVRNAVFNVSKAINYVNVTVDDVVYGENTEINISADVDGNYTVEINGTNVTVRVENGECIFNLSLNAGSYYANVTFNDPNYDSVVRNAVFNVIKAPNNIVVSVEDVVYGEDAVIVVSADVERVYIVDVNGTDVYVDVMNGKGNASLHLDAGSYYANLTFDNPNYDSSITNATFNVNKAVNNVVVSVEDVVYGNDAVIVVSADADGAYIVDVNGTNLTVNVVGGKGNARLSLDAGSYYANAIFINPNYESSITNAQFNVNKAVNNVNVTVEDVVYGEETVIVVSADVDGTYVLDVNGTSRAVDVVNGLGNFSLYLDAGSYYANATFSHPNYESHMTNALFKVNKAPINIVVSVEDVAYGEETVIVVSADLDRIYLVDVNGTDVFVDVRNGKGNSSLSLPVGRYYANITFNHPNYDSNITNAVFKVNEAQNDVIVSVEDVVYGEEAIIVVTAEVDGIYIVDVNGTNLTVKVVDGKGNASLFLDAGSYYANATFNNPSYDSHIINATFNVNKAVNNVVVSVEDVVYGNDAIIIISADVDGAYMVDVNGTNMTVNVLDGKGNTGLSLDAGSYYANATFNHPNYESSIRNAVFNVNKAVNNVVVSVGDVVYGNDAIIVVSADADGAYIVDVNGTYLTVNVADGYGNASISLSIGAYYANATFDNDNYISNIVNATFNVNRKGTVLLADNITAGVGLGKLDIALVSEGLPLEGKIIKVRISTMDLALITGADGLVTVDLSSLYIGNYTAYIVFEGDDVYEGSSAEVGIEITNNKKTGKDIQDLIDNAVEGSVIDLGYFEYENVSNVNITKSLTIKGSGTIITGAGDGSPMFNIIPKSKNGPDEVNITNIAFKLNNRDIVFKAIADNDTDIYSIDVANINIKGNTFSAIDDDVIPESVTILQLESERGILSPTGIINISANTIDAGVKPFRFTVTEIASGDDVHILPQNITPLRKATVIEYHDMNTTTVDESADGRIGEYFKVTLKDSDGNTLIRKDVQIGFNGVVYDVKTDEDGVAQLQINLKYKGAYTFAICFLGDEDYNASFVVAKITVNEQTPRLTVPDKSYAASAKTKTLTATFKSENGGLIADKWITFTVDGKTYKAKTNDKGVASVNVSLNKKGTYTFKAKYAGDSTYTAISKTAKVNIK